MYVTCIQTLQFYLFANKHQLLFSVVRALFVNTNIPCSHTISNYFVYQYMFVCKVNLNASNNYIVSPYRSHCLFARVNKLYL